MAKVLPEAKHFPCETKHCPHFHSNLSGYCEQCTRESSLLPPGIKKRVRRAKLTYLLSQNKSFRIP